MRIHRAKTNTYLCDHEIKTLIFRLIRINVFFIDICISFKSSQSRYLKILLQYRMIYDIIHMTFFAIHCFRIKRRVFFRFYMAERVFLAFVVVFSY